VSDAVPLRYFADGLKVVCGFLNVIFAEDGDTGLHGLQNFGGGAGFDRRHEFDAGGQFPEKLLDIQRNISHG
jgi:hypothetical protein